MQKQCCFETAAHRCWSAGWGRASPAAGAQGPRSGAPSPRPWPSAHWTAPAAGRSPAQTRRGSAGSPDTSASWCYLRADLQSLSIIRGLKLTKERTINSLLLLLDQQNSTFRNYFLIFKTSHGDTLKLLRKQIQILLRPSLTISLVIK